MKKFIFLLTTMFVFTLTACGGNGPEQTKVLEANHTGTAIEGRMTHTRR